MKGLLFPCLPFYKVVVSSSGWRTNSKRPVGAVCHREEKLQTQEKVGKGYESAQGETYLGKQVGIIRMQNMCFLKQKLLRIWNKEIAFLKDLEMCDDFFKH